MFKGSKVNDAEGEVIKVAWKMKEGDDDIANFSKNDMEKMKANVGDLVYLCDVRKILGGLKSVHTVYGEPHDEDGVVLLNNEHILNGGGFGLDEAYKSIEIVSQIRKMEAIGLKGEYHSFCRRVFNG